MWYASNAVEIHQRRLNFFSPDWAGIGFSYILWYDYNLISSKILSMAISLRMGRSTLIILGMPE